MNLFVGLDVSLSKTSICVINEHGKIIKEAEADSERGGWPAGYAIWTAASRRLAWRPCRCRNGFTEVLPKQALMLCSWKRARCKER